MKIRIVKDVPVGDEHGVRPGRVFDATAIAGREHARHKPRVTLIGDAGKRVALFYYEYEVIGEKHNVTESGNSSV